MKITQRLPRWSVALGIAAAIATGCGDEEPSSARPSATAASASARTATTTETTSPRPATTSDPASTPTDTSAEPTAAPGGATTAEACPSDQHPAVGALRITDGAVAWLACSPDEAYRTVIGANDDVVLVEEVGSASRQTIAFDAADGSERWRRATGHTPTPPGPFDGQGIVVLADQEARALVGVDVATGDERWRVASSEAPLANSPTVAVVWTVGDPSTPASFRGIDRGTGDELWVSDTMLSDQMGPGIGRSSAAVLDEVIAVPTGATVTAIDMRTGVTLWQTSQLDHLVAADGTIAGSNEVNQRGDLVTVTAIDAVSGQERWTAPGLPSYGGLLAIGDGVLVVLDVGGWEIAAYELASGNERWRVTRTTAAQPQLIDGTSLVTLWEGDLSVLSTTDGATLWSAAEPFGSALMNGVGTNGASVFVAINSRPWTD